MLDIYNSIRYCRKERWKHKLYFEHFNIPHRVDYEDYVNKALIAFNLHKDFCFIFFLDFDHSPINNYKGIILHNSTPQKWRHFVDEAINLLKNKEFDDRLLFIKAWNEWGEGNYLEPDSKWGRAYLDEFKISNM